MTDSYTDNGSTGGEGGGGGDFSSSSSSYDVIQRHSNLYDVVTKPDNQPTLAYDGDQAPVLLQHLSSTDPVRVQNALYSSYRLLGKYDNVARFTEFNVISTLVQLSLPDNYFNDRVIRETALSCIELVLKAPCSRTKNFILAAGTIATAVQDTDRTIRQIGYQCLINSGDSIETVETIVQAGFVNLLVQRISEELTYYTQNGSRLTDLALYTLYTSLVKGTQANVMDQAVECKPSLSHALFECLALSRPQLSTIENSVLCLSILCNDFRGKKSVLQENNSVETLLDFINYGIHHQQNDIAISAANVIMGLMAEDDGKRALLDSSLNVRPLINLINPSYGTKAIIIASTALATIAAHPRGRAHLVLPTTGAIQALRSIVTLPADDTSIGSYPRTAAQRAISVIEWVP